MIIARPGPENPIGFTPGVLPDSVNDNMSSAIVVVDGNSPLSLQILESFLSFPVPEIEITSSARERVRRGRDTIVKYAEDHEVYGFTTVNKLKSFAAL